MSGLKNFFARFRPAKAARERAPAGEPATWVIVGLGNPGGKYSRTRHNVGFMVLDRVAGGSKKFYRQDFQGLAAQAQIGAASVALVKPQTYYNLSGECVREALKHFNAPVERLIVVHDDLDLEAGRLKIKLGGGDAGNRGVRSITECLGTHGFIRVRVGIGRGLTATEIEYILTPVEGAELAALEPAFERAAEAVRDIITQGVERAMNTYNQPPRDALT
jgi:PTH1 family peptidyl-tRNA hydrolase